MEELGHKLMGFQRIGSGLLPHQPTINFPGPKAHTMGATLRPGVKQPVHWYTEGKAAVIQQGINVWVGSPSPTLRDVVHMGSPVPSHTHVIKSQRGCKIPAFEHEDTIKTMVNHY